MNYFEHKIYKILNEEDNDQEGGRIDMSDPVMKQTGWAKDRPDLTVGGALKQGKGYEYYDDAKDIVDNERGKDSGGEDEKEVTPAPKIDANPFGQEKPSDEPEASADDRPELDFVPKVKEPREIPKPEPENPDNAFDAANDYEPGTRSPEEAAGALGSLSVDIEQGTKELSKFDAKDADEAIQDVMDQYGVVKNKAGGFSTSDYDDATDTVSYKPVDDDRVNDILSKATRRTPNEIANLRDKVANFGVKEVKTIKQPFKEHYNRLFKGRDVL